MMLMLIFIAADRVMSAWAVRVLVAAAVDNNAYKQLKSHTSTNASRQSTERGYKARDHGFSFICSFVAVAN